LSIPNDPERLLNIPPEYVWKKMNHPLCQLITDFSGGTGLSGRASLSPINNGIIIIAVLSEIMVNRK